MIKIDLLTAIFLTINIVAICLILYLIYKIVRRLK